MCSYWPRTWRPIMYTPFAHALAYAINKTPYVILYWFSVKITLCMLYSVPLSCVRWFIMLESDAIVYICTCDSSNRTQNIYCRYCSELLLPRCTKHSLIPFSVFFQKFLKYFQSVLCLFFQYSLLGQCKYVVEP